MGVATNSTWPQTVHVSLTKWLAVQLVYERSRKICKKKKFGTPYSFIHGKVVTHSGKVVYTTIRIYTHEHYCRTNE